jgi:ankyrin repeat protein
VWNLARGADAVAAASAAASPASAAALLRGDDGGGGGEELGEGEAEALFEGLRLALAAAANCSSSPGRQAPLHLAASSPHPPPAAAETVAALVSLGARPDARDRSGATPAFVAAEAGREGALRALLTKGKADGRARNSAGEAPLYIASLRGHAGAVAALLDSFLGEGERRRRRDEEEEEEEKSATESSFPSPSRSPCSLSSPACCWTDPSLYGDGWTPVMAAALGGRKEVLRALLAAAAEAGGGGSGGGASAAAPLVRAANRYGQTALHIAARRGCLESLEALLGAARDRDDGDGGGGSGGGGEGASGRRKRPPVPLAALRDASGDSAADVAARAGHFRAAALLSSAASSASASAPSSASSFSPSYDAENVKAISPKWRPSENVLLGRRRRAAW